MATATSVDIERLADVPKGTYALDGSKRLVRTRADFYDTVIAAVRMTDPEMLASGRYLSPPSAGEEEAVYRKVSPGAKKLRDVEELRDYFANNENDVWELRHTPEGNPYYVCAERGSWYAWNWNTTDLRFREADLRKSYNVGDKVTAEVVETDITPYLSQIADPKFTRENWKDIIDKVNQIKGELAVPYARGHVIREMHPVYGIFTEIEPTKEHKTPFALHGWLRENLDVPQDPISGHYEVAVVRGGGWHHDEWCLYVGAGYVRWGADSDDGFRPVVRGSRPGGRKLR